MYMTMTMSTQHYISLHVQYITLKNILDAIGCVCKRDYESAILVRIINIGLTNIREFML